MQFQQSQIKDPQKSNLNDKVENPYSSMIIGTKTLYTFEPYVSYDKSMAFILVDI